MKHKLLFLIIVAVILTGCSATYDINIMPNKSSEETLAVPKYLESFSLESTEDVVYELFDDRSNIRYQVDQFNGLIVKRNFDKYSEINKNMQIAEYLGDLSIKPGILLSTVTFIPDHNKCYFMLAEGGEFVSDDTLTINVNIPFKVFSHNAEYVNGSKYTWVYNVNNCSNEIVIKYFDPSVYTYILIGIMFIVLSSIFIIGIKTLRANRI